MLCPSCQEEARRFGFDRYGNQRYRCRACRRTFQELRSRPLDKMRLSIDKAAMCLRLLLEGNSVRSTERLTGVHRDTILDLLGIVGTRCATYSQSLVRHVRVHNVQVDEIWGFVHCKEKTRDRKGYGEDVGDAWCFVAIERDTKLVLAWHVGKRSPQSAMQFSAKLRAATRGKFQLSTDGFSPYQVTVPLMFGETIDYAQLIKVYGNPPEGEQRYSPGKVIGAYPIPLIGTPDDEAVCTSHVERQNLTMRMQIRRLTRLTNAHSKKWENHEAALALHFTYYNFCRVHSTIKQTPAMAAGLTAHVWTIRELLEALSRWVPN